MKNILKRSMSLLTALMMILSLISVGVSAEVPEDYVVDANNLSVNLTHTAISDLPGYISIRSEQGNAAAKPKFYKQNGILGFTEDEAVLELIAREERSGQGNFAIKDLSFEADADFYVTTKFYIKDARETDVLSVYAKINDDSDVKSSASLFLYNKRSYRNLNSLYNQAGIYYVDGNWYNFTMALTRNADDDTKFDVKYYLDGTALYGLNSTLNKNIVQNAIGKDITIESFGIGFRNVSGTTEFGGIPQWCAVKDVKIVKGTFDPAKYNVAITSSAYTVNALSIGGGGVGTTVSGVPANTQADAFLANINTTDSGATKKVVKIAKDNLATTVVSGSEVVTSDMKLLITSTDGGMKLYDIDAAVDASLLPAVSSNETYPAYAVNASDKVISVPDTTVAKLKERITVGEGTQVSVTDANGFEVADSEAVTEAMKLVASKGNIEDTYAIEITKNYGFHGGITTTADTTLFSSTYTTSWSTTKGFFNPYNGSQASSRGGVYQLNKGEAAAPSENATYTVTTATIPDTSIPAYKTSFSGFGGWWYHESLGSKYCDELQHRAFTDSTKLDGTYDRLVTETDMMLENGAGAELVIRHTGKIVSQGTDFNLKSYTIGFEDGNIYVNPNLRGAGDAYTTGTEVGTYTPGKAFKIAIVEDKKVDGEMPAEAGVMNLEAIYVDDVKVFPLEGQSGNVATSSAVNYGPFASFIMASKGTVYWGKVDVYATDNYAVAAEEAEEAALSIESDVVTIEGDRIYGWESLVTVADFKAAVDSALTTKADVLSMTGSAALAETAQLENGMLFKITDKNYPENTAYYILAKKTVDSGTIISVDGDKLSASREVLVYTEQVRKNMTVILAVYEGDLLKKVELVSRDIQKEGDYNFDMAITGYDPETMTYKAFAWNANTLAPYEAVIEK